MYKVRWLRATSFDDEYWAGSQRAREAFIHFCCCPVTEGNPVLGHVYTSSHNLSCKLSLSHSTPIFLLSIRKTSNRIRQFHRDDTLQAFFLNAPILFISVLTDTVKNRDVWILSLLWLNHVAGETGPVPLLWSPLKDWQSDWWDQVSPAS